MARAEEKKLPRAELSRATRFQRVLSAQVELLAAMGHVAQAGMIARGDLAIACGWKALAPIQEAILRICAAAHVPCIRATEVLGAMAHRGRPTRAGIPPAAMGERAIAHLAGVPEQV